MKPLQLIIFIGLITVIHFSCSEELDPYGEFVDTYAFTCILKSDTTFQAATLFHSYRPDGFDPYTYNDDSSVKGADIRVWYNDSVFIFRDTSIVREDTSRYNSPFHFYYNNQFRVETKKDIELEVLLPNGKRLKSYSKTPAEIFFSNQSDVIIPAVGSDIVKFVWNEHAEGTFFSPRLAIRYKQNVNGTSVEKIKVVPVFYVQDEPVFPEPTNSSTIIYNLDAVSRALQEISEGDPDKNHYTVHQSLLFDVAAFDIPASRYVSSTSGAVDDLTVTVAVSDYTNIQGGLGLFGSYSKKNYDRIKFLQDYIESFGYNFLIEN